MIGRTLLHYEIVAPLGEGGMGVVYKARDTHLDRFVAIKILTAETLADAGRKRRFTLEAKAASALNHPGIVTIYDIATEGGIDFIAMEYVKGKTLGELIGRKGLGLTSALNYATQTADALARAHAVGIVHRDLKPSNIMVTDDGRVKILDFGVAKLATWASEDVEEAAAAETRTMRVPDTPGTEAGKIVGTVAYMSPEQAEGKKVDARSDIFSFGSVLYEMVTGTRLFQEATAASTLAAVLTKEPKPPGQITNGLPRDLERIILRCLRKDPARRVQFMADLAVELEEIKTESGTGIGAVAGPASTRRARTRRWLFGSTAAALLLAVAGAWLFWPRPAAPLAPEKLLPLTSLPGDERLTTFSPDGNYVAFTWSGEQRDNVDIYLKQIGLESRTRLTFDPAEDTAPAWSPDNSRIGFVRRKGDQAAIYVASPLAQKAETWVIDYRPTSVGTRTLSGYLTTISWFPDSKWLAVARQDADGQMNGIVAVPVDGGEPQKLVWGPTSEATYHFPVVSPSGASLAYASCKPRAAECVVNRLALAGVAARSTPAQLATRVGGVQGIAWGPAEQSVIFGSTRDGQHLERVAISTGVQERIELAAAGAVYPATSRKADQLAFVRRSTGGDIWKFEAGGTIGPVTFDALSSTLPEDSPQYSKKGDRIVFVSNRSGKGDQVYVANADGAGLRAVTDPTGLRRGSPRWSPSGNQIAYDGIAPEDGLHHIYVVNADGGPSHRLTHLPGAENVPSWSRDGNWIYFSSLRRDPEVSEIYKAPSSGAGEPELMTDNKSHHRTGSFTASAWESWEGTILYYASGGALFAKPLPDGQESQILPSVSNWSFIPMQEGIYYIVVPDPKAHPDVRELSVFDFSKRRSTVLKKFEAQGTQGITVSPDGSTVLISGLPISGGGDDLMLIQNYR